MDSLSIIERHADFFHVEDHRDPDGVYQLLPIPSVKPKTDNDLQTALAGILKSVS